MKKYFVLMFCFLFATFFASCKGKAGSDNPLTKSPMPGVSTATSTNTSNADSADNPSTSPTSPTEPFTLKVGDTLEIIDATLDDDNCTITFKNGTKEKTVHVNVKHYTQFQDVNQKDGIKIGKMEDDAHGGSLVLYVFKLPVDDKNMTVRFAITVDASEGQSDVLSGMTCIKKEDQSQSTWYINQVIFYANGSRCFASAEINKGDDSNCYFQFTDIVEN
jgi:hypothetical protein